MFVRKRRSNAPVSILVAVGIGVCCAVVFSMLVCALLASLITSGSISFQTTGGVVVVVQGISGMLGSWIAATVAKQQRLQVCLITAGMYFLCLLAMTALLFDGEYAGVVLSLMSVLTGGCIVALSGIRTKKEKKFKALKRAYR